MSSRSEGRRAVKEHFSVFIFASITGMVRGPVGALLPLLLVLGLRAPEVIPSFSLRVEVACADLEADERAETEARLVGELLTRGLTDGYLLLGCSRDAVFARWEDASETVAAPEMLNREPEDEVRELMHQVVASMLESIVEARAAASTSPQSKTATPESSRASTGGGDGDAEKEAKSLVALLAEGQQARPIPDPFRLYLGAAIRFDYIGTQIAGTWGPRLIAQFRGARGGVGAQFDYHSPLGRPDELTMSEWSGSLLAIGSPNPRINLSAGLLVSSLEVQTRDPLPAGSRGALRWGGCVQVDYTQPLARRAHLVVSLGGRWLSTRARVFVEQERVLTIPQFQLQSAVGVVVPF